MTESRFHLDYLLLFLRFTYVAYFEHVLVCWKRYGITIVAVRILEIPYPGNKYLKLATEALKHDVKTVKS